MFFFKYFENYEVYMKRVYNSKERAEDARSFDNSSEMELECKCTCKSV